MVNAQHPSPVVYANHEISHRVADMVMAAMFAITPRTVMAGSQGTSAVMTFGGIDYRTGERFVSYESVKGGFGARPVKDGINAVASTVSNMSNTPIEILEMSFPLRVEEYALVPDSGGAGTYRGGLGVRRVWRVLESQAHAAVCCERTVTPPFGLAGGLPGAPAKLALIAPHGNARKLTSKGGFLAPAGSLVVMEAPGSGGYGPPCGRDRAALSEDVLDGYVTPAEARRVYGVGRGLKQRKGNVMSESVAGRRPERAPTRSRSRPGSRIGGAPAARAASSRSATDRTRVAGFAPLKFEADTTRIVSFCGCKATGELAALRRIAQTTADSPIGAVVKGSGTACPVAGARLLAFADGESR